VGLVEVEDLEAVTVVTICRPEVRNAVDRATAAELERAFAAFDADPAASVAVLTGAGGCFCSGADLGALAAGRGNRVAPDGPGPMGPTRMTLTKPVVAAIEGHAVAGGLELALWCDLRVMASDAVLGVYCRRWDVPLVDGGTVRLPRLVGHGRAMDLILTGRPVGAKEALSIGLVDRVCPPGQARQAAVELAGELARLPQAALRSDRLAAIEQWGLPLADALAAEYRRGAATIESGAPAEGARRFLARRRGPGAAG
jgi:enoyl-CoA hydratase